MFAVSGLRRTRLLSWTGDDDGAVIQVGDVMSVWRSFLCRHGVCTEDASLSFARFWKLSLFRHDDEAVRIQAVTNSVFGRVQKGKYGKCAR